MRHSIWHPDIGRQAGDTTRASVTASSIQMRRREAGDTTRRIWHLTETGRHRDTSDTTPEPASQHLACDRSGASVTASGTETSGRQDLSHKKREMGDTERQAGNTTPEPVSQHLASRHRETASGIRPQRRPRRPWGSGRHYPAGACLAASGIQTQGDVTASGIRPQRRPRRHRETSGRHNPGAGITASGIRP